MRTDKAPSCLRLSAARNFRGYPTQTREAFKLAVSLKNKSLQIA
jgi:hypothetical protein